MFITEILDEGDIVLKYIILRCVSDILSSYLHTWRGGRVNIRNSFLLFLFEVEVLKSNQVCVCSICNMELIIHRHHCDSCCCCCCLVLMCLALEADPVVCAAGCSAALSPAEQPGTEAMKQSAQQGATESRAAPAKQPPQSNNTNSSKAKASLQ